MKKQNIALWIVGSIILTAIGFVVIPKLIKKYGDKVYKSSLQNEEIDFDDNYQITIRIDKKGDFL